MVNRKERFIYNTIEIEKRVGALENKNQGLIMINQNTSDIAFFYFQVGRYFS